MKIPVLSYSEDAEIVEARLTNLSVASYAPIRGTVTWKNKKMVSEPIHEGAPRRVSVGYAFGMYDPGTQDFTFLLFEVPGHDFSPFVAGSTLVDEVPARGETSTIDIYSYAPGVQKTVTLDVFQFLAHGTMRVYVADHNAGSRWVGLSWGDFQALKFRGRRIYQNAITISP